MPRRRSSCDAGRSLAPQAPATANSRSFFPKMRAPRIDRDIRAAQSETRAHKAAKPPANAKLVRAVLEIACVDLIGAEVLNRLKTHTPELIGQIARLEEELKRLTGGGHA